MNDVHEILDFGTMVDQFSGKKMQPLPKVISFYTLDTPYEEEVKYLQASCDRFGIDAVIEGIPSAGSWELNCAFKPMFILRTLETYRVPLLWVDADAVFAAPLEALSVFSADLAVRMYDVPDDHPSRIVTATLFVNATEAAKRVIRLWAEECLARLRDPGRTSEVWDQDALRSVLLERDHGALFLPLPPAYSKISGHPVDEQIVESPVIVQNQASRRYKRWINHPEERIFGL